MSKVVAYEHNDFGGASQEFPPGEYRAIQGQLGSLPNDSLSSLKVPLGLNVTLREHEENGREISYPPGDHTWVPPWFNDITSYIRVESESTLYLSTDDDSVPAWIDNVIVSFSSNGQNASGSISADLNDGWYKKVYKFPIPSGVTVNNVWEWTKGNSANWSYDISNDVLTITLSVDVRDPFGPRNWVGVRFTVA